MYTQMFHLSICEVPHTTVRLVVSIPNSTSLSQIATFCDLTFRNPTFDSLLRCKKFED